MPYLATVYPLEGAVPGGQTVVSADDGSLRGSVLSTWPDGSAQVVVLAGEAAVSAGTARSIGLGVAAPPAGTALTAARVSQLVTNISVNVPGVGSATLTDFSSPLRTWWANERVICASYRLPIGSGMVAIAYVHAFASNRALVEVVVENGEVNASAASVTAPSVKNYSGATVAVNGSTIATVSSPSAGQALVGRQPEGAGSWSGGHEEGRAWYVSTWIGGNPGIEVTHDTAQLQQHPWYWKVLETPTVDMQSRYSGSYDTYTPWSVGRLRTPGMANGGDDDQLALLPGEQTDYMATGNRFARRAVIATGLAMLSMGYHWRHTDGSVPQRSQYLGKSSADGGAGTWPTNGREPRWGGRTFDGSHIPATTLTAFLCHPSPVFIEIAQREGIWNHTNYGTTSGVHGYDQIRSRAWRARNYAIATFLTPDSDATRKADWRTVLEAVADYNQGFFDKSWNTLQCLWTMGNGSVSAESKSNLPDFDIPAFQHWFLVLAWNAVDRTKVARGTGAAKWTALADTIARMPVRLVNESPDGTWRVQHIDTYAGVRASDGSRLTQPANWYEAHKYWYGGLVGQPRAGVFVNPESGYGQAPQNGYYYDAIFFSALSVAVERGVTGADTAWQFVYTNNGISNFQTWRQQFRATTTRFSRFPRNKADTKL